MQHLIQMQLQSDRVSGIAMAMTEHQAQTTADAPSVRQCRYRRRLAGHQVCWASRHLSTATSSDCRGCEVPGVLEAVDCFYLQARVGLRAGQATEWICGSSGRHVNGSEHADWSPCMACRRVGPRRPLVAKSLLMLHQVLRR
ncbi:MAG TPA: hypothetical protein DEP45_13570 [Armatimonadetes bacterium]|nr:hypothetical protein [Armatimonadota bacterium]